MPATPVGAAGWAWLSLPDGARLRAEVMATAEEQHRGLMGRDFLPESRLMLFRYDEDGVRRVWMKGCKFAIDVAWIDAGGNVVAVAESLPPCTGDPCPQYGGDLPSRHFVEGGAGWLRAHGVAVGSLVGVGETREGP